MCCLEKSKYTSSRIGQKNINTDFLKSLFQSKTNMADTIENVEDKARDLQEIIHVAKIFTVQQKIIGCH